MHLSNKLVLTFPGYVPNELAPLSVKGRVLLVLHLLGAMLVLIFEQFFIVARNVERYSVLNLHRLSHNQDFKPKLIMEAQRVDLFIMTNAKFFESHQVPVIRDRLIQMDDSKWPMVQTLQFKDPTTSLIISILAGTLGIDRFMIGDTGMGVGKLLTCGGFYIWAIIDWFMIQAATREKNMEKLNTMLH